ncbi:uncharacterized protein LOC124473635 [Hypomesus transpacificus]|uniref:uncharacterized protein LOC124473635 n=1 Tax=Hypomesus transpacificus TaxID=137520 RepID=UPI001F08081C|nr:uncharacterized protein LOC124473635 [Hypomesus transpacificus]
MGEMPVSQPSECEGGRNNECILQQRTEVASIGIANRAMKIETGILTHSQAAELQFLRSRVRELEREKAAMASENQRLKNMLVKEIPGLLSTMWQTMGSASQNPHPASPQTVSAATGRDSFLYMHQHSMSGHSTQDRDYSRSLHQPMSNHSSMGQDGLNGDIPNYGAEMAASEDDVNGDDLDLSNMEGDDPHGCATSLCSPVEIPEMRLCSETHCGNGDSNLHVNHIEVYPGSGVFCEIRSWHAANQTQSPTAMARTLLLGVFDMDTLMNSNLRGGRSRRPTYPEQRNALDPHKINAIYNATLARFPLARKGQIGTGINSKLSEIRFRSRKVKRENI